MTRMKVHQGLLFKVLVNGCACVCGNRYKYPIHRWTKCTNPRICESGWHLTADPLRWWQPGAELYLAEGRGLIAGDGSDKAAFERVRLVQRIDQSWALLPLFPRVRCFLAASARSLDPKSDISWADLSEANLARANLTNANLSGANLSNAHLSGANLTCANLTGGNLFGADLFRANLSKVNLSGADLSGAWRDGDAPTGWEIIKGRLRKAMA